MSSPTPLAVSVPSYDPILARIVSETESSHSPLAVRFERKAFNNITNRGEITPVLSRIMTYNHCSQDTARMIYSTSWGMYQEMGFNIYNATFGFTGPIVSFANDVDAQGDM